MEDDTPNTIAMLNLPTLEVPLIQHPDATIRVVGCEVLLEEIVAEFEDGTPAEEVVTKHDGLRLSDLFLVLSFYLRNRKEVEDYLARRQPAA